MENFVKTWYVNSKSYVLYLYFFSSHWEWPYQMAWHYKSFKLPLATVKYQVTLQLSLCMEFTTTFWCVRVHVRVCGIVQYSSTVYRDHVLYIGIMEVRDFMSQNITPKPV